MGRRGTTEADGPTTPAEGPRRPPAEPPAGLPAELPVELLVLGGRSGSGKTSVAHEVSRLLREADVGHGLVDGDALGHLHPLPPDDPAGTRLSDLNLRALWRNLMTAGCRRVVYVTTVSVLEADRLAAAVGATTVTGVLLTASDATVEERLRGRETGTGLEDHRRRSATAAVHLDAVTPSWVVRLPTDGRPVPEVARAVLTVSGWSGRPAGEGRTPEEGAHAPRRPRTSRDPTTS